jgi:hypothetical protein
MSAEPGILPDTFLRSCATSLVDYDDAFNTFMRAYYSLLVGRMTYECVNASIVVRTASFQDDARAAWYTSMDLLLRQSTTDLTQHTIPSFEVV